MKTSFKLRTATLAIAVSLAGTAHASEAVSERTLTTEIALSASGSNPHVVDAEVSAIDQGGILIAEAFTPVVMDLPQLAAPVSIEPMVQEVIFAVDFMQDAGDGLLYVPEPVSLVVEEDSENENEESEASETVAGPAIYAPLQTDIPLYRLSGEFNSSAQQAIYDVDFVRDAAGGLLSINRPVAAPISDGFVTLRDLESYNLDAQYGDIDAFYGDIVAFYGDIDAFWGDINPFYGDIDAFYGDIDAFWGDINPFYGDISAFWGDIDAFWGNIDAFDAANLNSIGTFWTHNGALISQLDAQWAAENYNQVKNDLSTLTANAIAQFGQGGFNEAKAQEIMNRHGIDPYGEESLISFTAGQRAAFFMDWHDTVNSYAGVDHVDHWMGGVNWTPAVTQIQGSGIDTVVGVIDSDFGATGDLADNLVWSGGGSTKLNGHGAGVTSLIVGAHDGDGVMGIAPNASVTAYNPFAIDGTATWKDVATGIWAIKASTALDNILGADRRASVINLSLGESGWVAAQGLADIFQRWDIELFRNSTTYVIAAGNDGLAQAQDIEWGFTTTQYSLLDPKMDPVMAMMMGFPVITQSNSDTAAIFVGSVRPDGSISTFSNTPGDACLLDNGVCHAGNELKNFFVVAPGELLLVNDGNGGLVRRSGTSFAAPLVSGAIALLHDRWSWLADHPNETAEIIFRSAKDLGEPGVDAVYGHGLLDIVGSQSPLDFGSMTFTLWQKKGKNWRQYTQSPAQLLAEGGVPSWWNTDDVFFTAFEDIGNTFRDFAIPMSSFTYGKQTNALGNGYQRMQDFVSDRFANWLLSGGSDKDGDGNLGVSQVRSNGAETSGQWTMRYDAMPPRFTQDGAIRPVHNAATLSTPDGKASFTLGHGQGALALSGSQFGIMSDHDAETGGVNPVLGFASGELFAGVSYNIAPNTEISVGFSTEREGWEDFDTGNELDRQIQRKLGAREAEALTVSVNQNVTDRFSVGVQFTHLNEADALLGAQTGIDSLLGKGSQTDAMTVSANFNAGGGLSFDLSVTGGATETDDGQLLVTNSSAMSTAGQFAVNKRGVMNSRDILRFSVGQPLTVESGELELRSEQVVDRQTGERGVVSQFIGIDTKRRFTTEFVYATPVSDGAEFGLIGRYVSAGEIGQDESFMIGANFGLHF